MCLMRLNHFAWKDAAIGCDLCLKWFHGACVNLSEVQIDVLTRVPACKWFSVARVPKLSRRFGKESPLETSVEMHHLEKKISKVGISLEKIQNILKSPPFYAEKVKLTSNTNATTCQRSRYPQEQTFFINDGTSRDVLSSSIQQKKKINQLLPYIKLDYCFATKTDKILLLLKNADDCSKTFAGWKSNLLGKLHQCSLCWKV